MSKIRFDFYALIRFEIFNCVENGIFVRLGMRMEREREIDEWRSYINGKIRSNKYDQHQPQQQRTTSAITKTTTMPWLMNSEWVKKPPKFSQTHRAFMRMSELPCWILFLLLIKLFCCLVCFYKKFFVVKKISRK